MPGIVFSLFAVVIESDVDNLIDVFELKVSDWCLFLNEFGWKFPFRLFFSLFNIIIIFCLFFLPGALNGATKQQWGKKNCYVWKRNWSALFLSSP